MGNEFYGRANLVQKRQVSVVLQTTKQLIKGTFHARGMKRVIDELALEETFVAITDAKIFNNKGERLYKTGFVAVNRKDIVWMTPEENIVPREETKAG